MKHLLAVLFLILIVSVNISAQESKQNSRGPIEKIKTPNGSPAIRFPIVRGYLIDANNTRVRLLVDNYDKIVLEIDLRDIEVAYKLESEENKNHHKSAALVAGGTIAGVTIFKVTREDNIGPKELITDLKMPVLTVISYALGYWGSTKINGDKKKEIPLRMPFYDAAKPPKDTTLAIMLQELGELKNDPELELVLKQ